MSTTDSDIERLIQVSNRSLSRERDMRKRLSQVEKALAQSQRLQLASPGSNLALGILDGLPDSVFVFDANGAVTYVNTAACTLLGYQIEEIQALFVPDLAAGHREWALREYARFRHMGSWRGEVALRRKDRTTVKGEVTASVLPDEVYVAVFREAA